MAALHARVHRDDPAPATDEERQAACVLAGLQREILGLVTDGVPPELLEMALYHYWLRLATWNDELGEERFEAWRANTGSIREPLLATLRELAAALVDDGPTADAKLLGGLLEQSRAAYGRESASRRLRPRELEKKARTSLTRLGWFLDECYAARVHPSLLETALLYYWLRAATLTTDIREDTFQTLERNWDEVVACIRRLVERYGASA